MRLRHVIALGLVVLAIAATVGLVTAAPDAVTTAEPDRTGSVNLSIGPLTIMGGLVVVSSAIALVADSSRAFDIASD